MLEEEFTYFMSHQIELYAQFPDEYLVIKNKGVVAHAPSVARAMEKAAEQNLEPGSFLLQYCGADEWAYTRVFHTRVRFA